MPRNHLFLVDGSSYIFRAYHRLPLAFRLADLFAMPIEALFTRD